MLSKTKRSCTYDLRHTSQSWWRKVDDKSKQYLKVDWNVKVDDEIKVDLQVKQSKVDVDGQKNILK